MFMLADTKQIYTQMEISRYKQIIHVKPQRFFYHVWQNKTLCLVFFVDSIKDCKVAASGWLFYPKAILRHDVATY